MAEEVRTGSVLWVKLVPDDGGKILFRIGERDENARFRLVELDPTTYSLSRSHTMFSAMESTLYTSLLYDHRVATTADDGAVTGDVVEAHDSLGNGGRAAAPHRRGAHSGVDGHTDGARHPGRRGPGRNGAGGACRDAGSPAFGATGAERRHPARGTRLIPQRSRGPGCVLFRKP